MNWVINCVLVFSVFGLAFSVAGHWVSDKGPSDSPSRGAFLLCGFTLMANIIVIILSKLGIS